MPGGIDIKIQVKGIRQVQQMLRRLSGIVSRGAGRTALHARYAIIASQWIDRNFQQEGKLAGGWRPLRPNTLAGRRKGSGRILQDKGLLRASFHPQWDDRAAIVGSPSKIAGWQHRGTKGSPETPYPIEPKKKGGLLRFKVATRFGVRTVVGPSGRRLTLPFAEGGFVFARRVVHPGLPSRRLLPLQADLMLQLLKATIGYVKEQEKISREGG